MPSMKTKRQRERVDPATGMTGGAVDDLLHNVKSRFVRANKVARASQQSTRGSSGPVDTTAANQAPVDQRARLEAAAKNPRPHMDATAYAERKKDPLTSAVRQYRKEKYGIDNLNTATAEQIEQARKDPQAFRRGRRTSEKAQNLQQQLAQAQAAASGTKPSDFTGYPGGRQPAPTSSTTAAPTLSPPSRLVQSLQNIASQASHRRPRKRKRASTMSVSGGSG